MKPSFDDIHNNHDFQRAARMTENWDKEFVPPPGWVAPVRHLDGTVTPGHIADTAPTCITCRHARKGVEEYFCDMVGRRDVVTGAYGLQYCQIVRDFGECGPGAKWWKAIEA